ncbi:hypothetical protein FHR71_001721 [Methylobacterium sp. RAS18]|nr:hypothetical protein [Methylobacterium sp. RAS18]
MPRIRSRGPLIDPTQLREGFSSLASAFAPPSAQEMLAGAKIRETNQKVSQIADLYSMARDPNADRRVFDRSGIVAGLYGPNQSFEALDIHDRRSGLNNAADNERALTQTRLQQRGELDRAMLAPVGAGGTRFVPGSIASAYGVPEQQVGVVSVNPGDRAVLPDGRTIDGAPKPLTDDQLRAQIIGTLPANEQRAWGLGSTPVENVQTPAGPRIAFRSDAVGQMPLPDIGKQDLRNYQTPDGRSGTARFDAGGGGWIDTQTGTALPAGAQTYTSQLQGGKNETGLGASTRNDIQGQLVDLANLESVVNQFDDLIKRDPSAIGTTGRVLGFGQDVAATAQEVTSLLSPRLQEMARQAEQGLIEPDVLTRNFNPNIPQATLLENLLVAQLAKVNDPNGRLSNQQMEETRKALGGGGWFQNAQRTRASLDGIRQQIAAKRGMYRGLEPQAAAIGPGATPAPAAQAPAPVQGGGPTERWEKGPDGRPRRVQ